MTANNVDRSPLKCAAGAYDKLSRSSYTFSVTWKIDWLMCLKDLNKCFPFKLTSNFPSPLSWFSWNRKTSWINVFVLFCRSSTISGGIKSFAASTERNENLRVRWVTILYVKVDKCCGSILSSVDLIFSRKQSNSSDYTHLALFYLMNFFKSLFA